MQNVFYTKSLQVIASGLLAVLLSLTLGEVSPVRVIALFVFIVICLYAYRLLIGYINSTPVFLTKILVFFAFINTGFIIGKFGSVTLFPYRILAPVVFLVCIISLLNRDQHVVPWNEIKIKPILIFFLFWICYSLLSLIWVKTLIEGIRGFLFLFLGISFICLFALYFKKFKDYLDLFYIWLAAFLILLTIGIWENISGHHLPLSQLANATGYKKHIPTAVFHNQNDYATYLTISVFFVIAFVRYSKSLMLKVCGCILIVVSLYLLYETNSRANYLALVFGCVLWFIFLMSAKERRRILVTVTPLIVILCAVLHHKLFSIFNNLDTQFSFGGSSFGIRVNLIRNSMMFIFHSFGLGVGSGNAQYYMEHYEKFPTKMIFNVHNWWMQILVEYGVFVFVGYVLVYIALIISLYRVFKRAQTNQQKMICTALLGGLFAFPLASISSSSIMGFKFQWVFIAFAIGYLNLVRMGKDKGSSTEYR